MSLFQKCGSAIGEHASNTFYKAIKFSKNGRYRILTLGEIFLHKNYEIERCLRGGAADDLDKQAR